MSWVAYSLDHTVDFFLLEMPMGGRIQGVSRHSIDYQYEGGAEYG